MLLSSLPMSLRCNPALPPPLPPFTLGSLQRTTTCQHPCCVVPPNIQPVRLISTTSPINFPTVTHLLSLSLITSYGCYGSTRADLPFSRQSGARSLLGSPWRYWVFIVCGAASLGKLSVFLTNEVGVWQCSWMLCLGQRAQSLQSYFLRGLLKVALS